LLRSALDEKKADFAAEKGRLLLQGMKLAYYTTQKSNWTTGTSFQLKLKAHESTLASIFAKEELRAAKIARCIIVKTHLHDAGQPLLKSEFFLRLTECQ
jgi:hypothetical protein